MLVRDPDFYGEEVRQYIHAAHLLRTMART